MSPTNKRVVAFWSYALTYKKNILFLLDRDLNQYFEFKLERISEHLRVLEINTQTIYSIYEKANRFELFNHKENKSLDLEEYSGFFKGYDYASSQYYMAHINKKEVKIYDYESDDYHFYCMEEKNNQKQISK